ncbi:glycoside hydrolase family 88 protein [Pelagicoccus albus]|uniref:Glycoside hydrolase family 88 protein n=1 Tax=Pelagicoccus albus TaxID=415222 RepID=A0A7X1E9G8_9BACT|nr:glycoside hydrolase family 88 protein [Pelagicoccus albus]
MFVLSFSASTEEVPARKKVLKSMLTANDYFMRKWSDPSDVIPAFYKDRVYPSNIWTRAVYYEGLMALHTIYPKEEFLEYALEWAESHEWGMRKGTTTRNADDHCAGQTYLELYEIEPDPIKIRDIRISMDMLINTPQNDDWSWIDAIQMSMPILAKLGVMYDDPRYLEKAYSMYSYSKRKHGGNGLFNPEDGLWWRDKGFVPPYTEPNGEDCYWSRGNGWVVAALVRVLDIIPADSPHRAEYEADLSAMLEAVKAVQREDGFWNVSLHDPEHFGGKETTGTALFVYGMAWGINNGLLSRDDYLAPALRGWRAISEESIHENGFLGYVQGTGKEPKDGQPVAYDHEPDFDDYGLGCVLLAGTEIYKLEP